MHIIINTHRYVYVYIYLSIYLYVYIYIYIYMLYIFVFPHQVADAFGYLCDTLQQESDEYRTMMALLTGADA